MISTVQGQEAELLQFGLHMQLYSSCDDKIKTNINKK